MKCICLKGVFGAPRRWGSQLLQCVLRSLPPCRWCLASVAMHTALPGCPASLGEDGGAERIRFCWFQSKGMRFRYKQRERESSRSFEHLESANITFPNPCKMFITWGENKRPDFYHFVPQGGGQQVSCPGVPQVMSCTRRGGFSSGLSVWSERLGQGGFVETAFTLETKRS